MGLGFFFYYMLYWLLALSYSGMWLMLRIKKYFGGVFIEVMALQKWFYDWEAIFNLKARVGDTKNYLRRFLDAKNSTLPS